MPPIFERFTAQARDAINAGVKYSRRADDRWVEPAHLLFGVLNAEAGVAAAVCARYGWDRPLAPSADPRYPEDEEAITIVVTDNGPGVAPELVPRIFLDGYSTKSPQGGSWRGLGLALVHRMVTHSGGSVQVTRAEAGGARFTVVIPKQLARRDSTSIAKVPTR